jgi:hypothetical protein
MKCLENVPLKIRPVGYGIIYGITIGLHPRHHERASQTDHTLRDGFLDGGSRHFVPGYHFFVPSGQSPTLPYGTDCVGDRSVAFVGRQQGTIKHKQLPGYRLGSRLKTRCAQKPSKAKTRGFKQTLVVLSLSRLRCFNLRVWWNCDGQRELSKSKALGTWVIDAGGERVEPGSSQSILSPARSA